jgi:hypothetical protein
MTKMTRKEAQGYAKIMRVFAQEHLEDGLNDWKGESEMIEMVRSDSKDFRGVAQLLRANKIQEARDLAGSLDTAARERIPDDVWDAMEQHCDYTEEEYETITRATLDNMKARRDLLNTQIEQATKAHTASKRRT